MLRDQREGPCRLHSCGPDCSMFPLCRRINICAKEYERETKREISSLPCQRDPSECIRQRRARPPSRSTTAGTTDFLPASRSQSCSRGRRPFSALDSPLNFQVNTPCLVCDSGRNLVVYYLKGVEMDRRRVSQLRHELRPNFRLACPFGFFAPDLQLVLLERRDSD